MEHYKYSRACWLVLALFVGHIQIAFAQADSSKPFGEWIYQKQTWDRFWYSGNPTSGYNPVPSTLPVPNTKPVGSYDLYIDPDGKPSARTKSEFKFPNSNPDIVDVNAKFNARSMAGALGRFAQKVIAPLAWGSALYDLARELGFWISRNPDGSVKVEKDANPESDGFEYRFESQPWQSTHQAGCDQTISGMAASSNWVVTSAVPYATQQCTLKATQYGGPEFTSIQSLGRRGGTCAVGQYLINGTCQENPRLPVPMSELEDAIADKGSYSPNSRILDAIRDAIKAEPDGAKRPELETPKVTGPSESTSPKTETKETPEAIVTTTTKNNYQYIDNTVKNTSTTTIHNYNKVTNTTTTTVVNNSSPNPEPPKDFCKDNPDRAGCMDVDTPELEIPKSTKNVSYVAEQLFGGGTCPAAVQLNTSFLQVQQTFSYQSACDFLSSVIRPLVIAIAGLFAYGIIVGALKS